MMSITDSLDLIGLTRATKAKEAAIYFGRIFTWDNPISSCQDEDDAEVFQRRAPRELLTRVVNYDPDDAPFPGVGFIRQPKDALLSMNYTPSDVMSSVGGNQWLNSESMVYLSRRDYAQAIPVLSPDDASESNEASGMSIRLTNIQVVDASSLSWEHILDFRCDKDSFSKFQKLRAFWSDNYVGKSRTYVEDDIAFRIDEYLQVVRRWGMTTRLGILEGVMRSKGIAGVLATSVAASLLEKDFAALISAVSSIPIAIGEITLGVQKRRLEFQESVQSFPLLYLIDAKPSD